MSEPKPKEPVPFLNFSSLQNAVAELEKTVTQFSDKQQEQLKQSKDLDQLNKVLYQAEQKLLSDNGLPRRPWYRHTIYAPGLYTGYGVKTLPGIREAIEQRNWKEAQEQIEVVAQAILNYKGHLDKALGNSQ